MNLEFIQRNGKSHREACFPPEQTKTVVVQIEVVSLKVSFRCSPNKFRLRQVKATVEYVVGQDEVSAKPVTLERKAIQSTMPVFTW